MTLWQTQKYNNITLGCLHTKANFELTWPKMIPEKLSLQNFLCYGEDVPTLDFREIHVACLCGNNGHGKSALLDAITWVLWGRSRTRTQEELLRQGSSNMQVELSFSVNKQLYRVIRKYGHSGPSKKGVSILELYVHQQDSSFIPITGNTIKETESNICKILGLDYETFINTAFLMQGKADLFTRSTPAKRKDCLSEVLGLSVYEKISSISKTRAQTITKEISGASIELNVIESEIKDEAPNKESIKTINLSLSNLKKNISTTQKEFSELQTRLDSLLLLEKESVQTRTLIKNLEKEIDALHIQKESHKKNIGKYQETIERKKDIVTNYESLQRYNKKEEELSQKRFAYDKSLRQVAVIREEVAQKRGEFSSLIEHLQKTKENDLLPSLQKLPSLEKSIAKTNSSLITLNDSFKKLSSSFHSQIEELATKSLSLELENKHYLLKMEDSRKKFDMLEGKTAICPLCETSIRPSVRKSLQDNYRSEGHQSREIFNKNKQEKERVDVLQKSLSENVKKEEAQYNHKKKLLEQNLTSLESDAFKINENKKLLQQTESQIDEISSKLNSNSFMPPTLLSKLETLENQLSSLNYNQEEHENIRLTQKKLLPYFELNQKLNQSISGVEFENEALSNIYGLIDSRISQLDENKTLLKESLLKLPQMPGLKEHISEKRTALSGFEREHQQASVKKEVLLQREKRVSLLKKKASALKKDSANLIKEKGIYEELSIIFGKNGIPAMLIETALPQLEIDANDLLSRLTDMRLSVKFEFIQGKIDQGSGIAKEELIIKVGDELGTRPYESFSGGEAFRIDFAIRIALSKLLARRSGTPLPILFIDEGFGSQDAAGQERIIESIQSIQDQFEKILVITHIDQLKEAFPYRIEVFKTLNGSLFSIAG